MVLFKITVFLSAFLAAAASPNDESFLDANSDADVSDWHSWKAWVGSGTTTDDSNTHGRLLLATAYVGTVAAAMTGSIIGAESGLDIYGAVLVGCITSLGGATIRDSIILDTQSFWVEHFEYVLICVATGLVTFFVWPMLLEWQNRKDRDRQEQENQKEEPISAAVNDDDDDDSLENRYTILDGFLDTMDASSLSAWAIVGAHEAYDNDLPLAVCAISGMITACFGGIIRDVLCGRPARVLHSASEVYAILALICAIVYLVMKEAGAPHGVQIGAAFATGILSRLLAVLFDIKLHTWDTTGDNLGVAVRRQKPPVIRPYEKIDPSLPETEATLVEPEDPLSSEQPQGRRSSMLPWDRRMARRSSMGSSATDNIKWYKFTDWTSDLSLRHSLPPRRMSAGVSPAHQSSRMRLSLVI